MKKLIRAFLLLCLVFSFSRFAMAQDTVKISWNIAGTYSFTTPSQSSAILLSARGGGGGGGGASAYGYRNIATGVASAGGGGGGQGCRVMGSASANTLYNFTVGKGGAGGSASTGNGSITAAGNGGATTISTLNAAGGSGGAGASETSTNAYYQNFASGAGGAGGCSTAKAGGNACSDQGCTSTSGESSFPAFGPAARDLIGGSGGGNLSANGANYGGTSSGPGYGGTAPGAGGGGATARSNDEYWSASQGGAGSDGQVLISFVLNRPVPQVTSRCVGDPITFVITNPEISQTVNYYLCKGNPSNRIGMFSLDPTTNELNYIIPAALPENDDIYFVEAEYVNLNVSSIGASSVSYGSTANPGSVAVLSEDIPVRVSPRINPPEIRWNYDHVCVIDESYEDNPSIGYYANLILWDSLVMGYADVSQLVWYDAPTGGDVLKENGVLTPAGTAANALQDFWQNQPHAPETYWVSLKDPSGGYCESNRREVRVEISDREISIPNLCFATYTRQTPQMITWDTLVDRKLNMDETYQDLLWFADSASAYECYSRIASGNPPQDTIPHPQPLDLSSPFPATTYWTIRYDYLLSGGSRNIECASKPFSITAAIYPHPDAVLSTDPRQVVSRDTLCKGESANLYLHILKGTAPFYITGIRNTEELLTQSAGTSSAGHPVYYITLPASALQALGANDFHLSKIRDSHSGTLTSLDSCFLLDDQGFIYSTPNDATLVVFDKPVISENINALAPACDGTLIPSFPTPPAFVSNSGNDYSTGWKIGNKMVTAPYTLALVDSGKPLRFFVANRCDTVYSNSVLVQVYPNPVITPLGSTTFCSGDTLQLVSSIAQGSWSSSIDTVAYVGPFSGIVRTDFILFLGMPVPRPSDDPNEGLGGSPVITFTTGNGCVGSLPLSITPRTRTPILRQNYDTICPVDENTLVQWDSLVYLPNPANPSGGTNVDLTWISWYDTIGGTFLRNGCAGGGSSCYVSGVLQDFWLNQPHAKEAYAATITQPGYCESRPVEVEVFIRERPTLSIAQTAAYCKGEAIPVTLTGEPPFTVTYTVDQQNGTQDMGPSSLGLPTYFDQGATGVEDWTLVSPGIYHCTMKSQMEGILKFKITKIEDGNGCRHEKP